MTAPFSVPSAALERALAALLDAARSRPELARELEASVPVFFAGPAPMGDPNAAWLAARRHSEWFLLERHSPALRGSPAERLLGPLREALVGEDEEERAALEVALEGLLTSATGAFEVEEVRANEGAWLRDVSGFAQYALLAPELSTRLETGDLLVGRLHPIGDGLHLASPAAGVFRGPGIVAALERDLTLLRQGPGAKVLRLAQAELERMFFSAADTGARPFGADGALRPGALAGPDPRAVIEQGRAWLLERDLEPAFVEGVLARLAAVPLEPAQVTPGLGDALGDILVELAFETQVDLDLARLRLLDVWRAFAALQAEADSLGQALGDVRPAAPAARGRRPDSQSHSQPRAGSNDAERARAVDEFARNRAAGADAQAELAALREALGLDEDDGDEEDSPAPDFPGVVGAMVHEFVWETSVTAGETAARELAPLAHLATFAAPIGVFEELGGRELVRFASFWVIERRVVRDPDAARALLAALRRFGEWCRDAHEHDVMATLAPALDGLEASLPRVVEANAHVSDDVLGPERAAPAADAAGPESIPVGDVFEVLDESASRFRSAEGDEVVLELDPRVRARLAAGDRVRGRAASGVLAVARVYPPEAALGR